MRRKLALAMLVTLGMTAVAMAADKAITRYHALGGMGELVITREANATRFEIEALGYNGHMCDLAGEVRSGIGVVAGEGGAPECRIRLIPKDGGFDVEAITMAECRSYCGLRGMYEYRYRPRPAACSNVSLQARQTSFLRDYRARRYAAALETAKSTDAECGAFSTFFDTEALANDIAITYYHLGRPGECLEVLRNTQGWDAKTDDDAVEGLPPLEADAYRPIVKATRTNQRLCEGLLRKRGPG